MQKVEALAWVNTILAEDPARRDHRYIKLLDQIDGGQALVSGSALEISRAERQRVRSILAAPNFSKRRYRLFLLLRINAALDGDTAVHLVADATIEHIFPARPAVGSRWLSDFDNAQAAQFRNMLGNLTLLTEVEQNRARNHDFDAKHPVLEASVFSLSRRLKDQTAWRPKDVERATVDMVELLMQSWGLA